VLGLLRIALAWIPALCVNAQYPLNKATSLVRLVAFEKSKGDHARYRVHEGDVDLHSLSNQILDFSEHGQIILGLDVFGVGGVQASDKATQRGDANTLTDTKDGYICCLGNERFTEQDGGLQVSIWVAPASRAV